MVEKMPINASFSSLLCDAALLQNCRCKNPFIPVPQLPHRVKTWHEIRQMNIDLIEANYTWRDLQPDLVLYGDSLTERLLGRMFGNFGIKMQDFSRVTERVLTKEGGGKINGLPLGISSDEIPHLLFRLANGELPSGLKPRIFWILIGTNDARMGCSSDVIVAGTIRIVNELRQRSTTNTPIVVNSLLPRGDGPLLSPRNAIWRILSTANHKLACYSKHTPGVFFANVTDKFIQNKWKWAGSHTSRTVHQRQSAYLRKWITRMGRFHREKDDFSFALNKELR